MEQKPSIGRIVHYITGAPSLPRAAIITRVLSDQCVDLTVFHRGREPECVDAVHFKEKPDGALFYWTWPPRV